MLYSLNVNFVINNLRWKENTNTTKYDYYDVQIIF